MKVLLIPAWQELPESKLAFSNPEMSLKSKIDSNAG